MFVWQSWLRLARFGKLITPFAHNIHGIWKTINLKSRGLLIIYSGKCLTIIESIFYNNTTLILNCNSCLSALWLKITKQPQTQTSDFHIPRIKLLLHVTFEFYLMNFNNVSITVMYENADSGTRGLCIISFPLHPHRGAGSQTSARTQAFIWFRELPLSCASSAHEVSQYGMSALLHCWQRLMLLQTICTCNSPRLAWT